MKDLDKLRDASGRPQAWLSMRSGIDRATISMAENRQIVLRQEQEDLLRSILISEIKKRQEALAAITKEFQPEARTATS